MHGRELVHTPTVKGYTFCARNIEKSEEKEEEEEFPLLFMPQAGILVPEFSDFYHKKFFAVKY